MFTFSVYPDTGDTTNFHDALIQSFVSKGGERVPNCRKADFQVYTLHPRLFSIQTLHLISRHGKKILLRFEPEVVNPLIYSKRIRTVYSQLLDIGKVNIIGNKPTVIRWPYLPWKNPATLGDRLDRSVSDLLKSSSISRREIDCVMIASQKFPFARNENYSLRARIAFLRRDLGIKVYGMKWKLAKSRLLLENMRIIVFFISQLFFPNLITFFVSFVNAKREHIDAIDDKFDVLSRSRFTLVIENSDEYVSEKILDAFISGSIPLYKGPDLSPFGIPQSAYLQVPDDLNDIPRILESLSDLAVNELQQAGREFCLSIDGLPSWDPKVVAEGIVTAILEKS